MRELWAWLNIHINFSKYKKQKPLMSWRIWAFNWISSGYFIDCLKEQQLIRHSKEGITRYLMQCPGAAASLTQFVLATLMNDSLCPEKLTYVCIRILSWVWTSLHALLFPLKLLFVLQLPEIRLDRSEIVWGNSFLVNFHVFLNSYSSGSWSRKCWSHALLVQTWSRMKGEV